MSKSQFETQTKNYFVLTSADGFFARFGQAWVRPVRDVQDAERFSSAEEAATALRRASEHCRIWANYKPKRVQMTVEIDL